MVGRRKNGDKSDGDDARVHGDVDVTKSNGQRVQNLDLEFVAQTKRRASPRLNNVPGEKRPYYGPPVERRRLLNSPVLGEETAKSNEQRVQNLDPEFVAQTKRRASPRLKNVPGEKRPYYGPPVERRRLSNSPVRGEETGKSDEQRVQNLDPEFVAQTKRRASPRLKNLPGEKRPYYGPPVERRRLSNSPVRGEETAKKRKSEMSEGSGSNKEVKQDSAVDMSSKDGENLKADGGLESTCSSRIQHALTEVMEVGDDKYMKWIDYEKFVVESMDEKADSKVKETMRVYNKYYLQYVKEEENRCKKEKEKRGKQSVVAKHSCKRPDLKAVSKMSDNKEILFSEKQFGHLPGIFVGHQFFSRCEMVAIGFHGHWLKGIDYIHRFSGNLKKQRGNSTPLAVAIVLSGQYEDDVDLLNEVVYTGQGGNDLLGNKHQIKDQELVQGNLALKNNMHECVPVRVIRGHPPNNKKNRKIYTYCGLYKVVDHWSENGVSGFMVLKYRLKRLLGQPTVQIDQVHFERAEVSQLSKLPGLVCEDISRGEEPVPVPVTNVIDNSLIAPADFKYSKSVQVAKGVVIPPNFPGCKCKGDCNNSNTCSCAQLNGGDLPYVRVNCGRLIEPKDVIFECGPGCGCGSGCINRTSQQGIKYQLEIYRTEKKGWAVRSWDYIPAGAPVCEYTGVLRRNDELDNVSENDYIFDIDCWQTMHEIGGRERRQGDAPIPKNNLAGKVDDKMVDGESEFCIDAGSCGNVARFINHSCEPNLFVQCVLSAHRDVRLARIVLFACESISPLQELTYDYGYALDSVAGPDGKIKQLACHCGTSDCRKRLY